MRLYKEQLSVFSDLNVEIYGFIKGFSSLLNPRLPHVRLNPLMREIPEIDATIGGTMLGLREIICLVRMTNRLKRFAIVCVN